MNNILSALVGCAIHVVWYCGSFGIYWIVKERLYKKGWTTWGINNLYFAWMGIALAIELTVVIILWIVYIGAKP